MIPFHSPRFPTLVRIGAVVAMCSLLAGLVAAASHAGTAQERSESREWASFFGMLRPAQAIDNRRVIVVFDAPSLADAATTAGRPLSPAEQRRFLTKAAATQKRMLRQLRKQGLQFDVRHTYLKVVNGAALTVHGDALLWLRQTRGVASVSQVRTVYPVAAQERNADAAAATAEAATGAAAGAEAATAAAATPAALAAGSDVAAARTPDASDITVVAVLDTGTDFNHPQLRRRQGGPGYDVLTRTSGTLATAADEHGTQVAGAIAASAPEAVRIESIRVLSSQPVLGGHEAVIGHTDDLLAGFERAVDRDGDGSTDDRASVVLAALSAPFAGFPNSPESRAVRGAEALGVVTVAAAGNDGASGDHVGTVGAPASSEHALSVGAADMRRSTTAVDVAVRGGLLDTVIKRASVLTRNDTLPTGEFSVISIGGSADDVVDYLGADVRSRVHGAIALVERDPATLVADQVRAAADAGAVAVLVSDAGDASASGVIDVRGVDVPAIGIASDDADSIREAGDSGQVRAGFVQSGAADNARYGSLAAFSSRGPRVDGSVRPDVVASGVGVLAPGVGNDSSGKPRYRVVSGTSIAAAAVAGQAAALRAARPMLSAEATRSAIVGSAHLLGEPGSRASLQAQGAGVADAVAAARLELLAEPSRVQFGVVPAGGRGEVALRFVSAASGTEAMFPVLTAEAADDSGLQPSITSEGLAVQVPAGTAPGVYGGWLTAAATGTRVPWTIVVRPAGEKRTVPVDARLSQTAFKPRAGAGSFGSRLTVLVGASSEGSSLGLRPAAALRVTVVGKGRTLGTLGSMTEVLPGTYTFGLTGYGPAGDRPLPAGRYELVVQTLSGVSADEKWVDSDRVAFRIR